MSLFAALDADYRTRREGAGGGGGKVKVSFGRTGARGRAYGTSKAARTASTSCVVKAKFVKAGRGASGIRESRRHIRAHIGYIQERERGEKEPQQREFFDRHRDGVERDEVEKAMLDGRGEKVAMHKLILSPGDNEIDVRQYTRESMEALEGQLGHKLDWYAIVHENTEHHHAHVVIAGQVPDRERYAERERNLDERPLDGSEWVPSERGKDASDLFWDSNERQSMKQVDKERADERDPSVRDILSARDDVSSPESFRINRMLDRYDRDVALQNAARISGDVFIDRGALDHLREAGNEHIERERSLDRTLEHEMSREFTRDLMPEHELEPEHKREIDERELLEKKPENSLDARIEQIREAIEGRESRESWQRDWGEIGEGGERDERDERDDEGEGSEDPMQVRIDLLGGRPELTDDEREQEENRDHYGNEM